MSSANRATQSTDAQPPTRPHRGPPWNEDSIREALTAFLEGRTSWPTYNEFIAAGLKGLRDVLPRFGGPDYWAQQMAIREGPRRSGGVVRWTDDAIRTALSPILSDRSVWPTNREFRDAGLGGLYEKLSCEGTTQKWAAEFEVAAPAISRRKPSPKTVPKHRRTRQPPPWTDERITTELAAFIDNDAHWPRYKDFVSGDRKRLYQAVLNHGGPAAWAQRMGVDPSGHIRHERPPWTEELIRERLVKMLRGRTSWPTSSEFVAAGEQGLLAAIRRRGGIEYWTAAMGVAPPSRRRPHRQGQRTWTDKRIVDSLAPLVGDLGRWPTKSEFRKAGLGPALSAIYDHGGSALWQHRLGVEARDHHGPVPDRRRWNEATIERELICFCEGRSDWPTLKEFDEAGLSSLYRAAVRYGGITRWRERLALD